MNTFIHITGLKDCTCYLHIDFYYLKQLWPAHGSRAAFARLVEFCDPQNSSQFYKMFILWSIFVFTVMCCCNTILIIYFILNFLFFL